MQGGWGEVENALNARFNDTLGDVLSNILWNCKHSEFSLVLRNETGKVIEVPNLCACEGAANHCRVTVDCGHDFETESGKAWVGHQGTSNTTSADDDDVEDVGLHGAVIPPANRCSGRR